MTLVPSVIVGDIGSKKARFSEGNLLHGEEWSYQSFAHRLGILAENPNGALISETEEFEEFCREFKSLNFTPSSDRPVSRNYICGSAPLRYMQNTNPGEFGRAVFDNLGIFPLVLDGLSESIAIEAAIWSELSTTRSLLEGKKKAIHLHPGGLSLEINESSDGVLHHSACLEHLGVVCSLPTNEAEFTALIETIKIRINGDVEATDIFKSFDQDTALVISGKFARKIVSDLVSLGVKKHFKKGSESYVKNAQVTRDDIRKLADSILKGRQLSSLPKLFSIAVLEAAFELLDRNVAVVSDARLVHGLIEMRRKGSFNEVLIPEIAETHMDRFIGSLEPIDLKDAKRFAGNLAHALYSPYDTPSGNSERATAIQIASIITAYDDSNVVEYFAANRAPGIPRLFQEGIVSGLRGENLDQAPERLSRLGQHTRWVAGFVNAIAQLSKVVSPQKHEIHVTDNGSTLEIKCSEPRDIKIDPRVLGFEKIKLVVW